MISSLLSIVSFFFILSIYEIAQVSIYLFLSKKWFLIVTCPNIITFLSITPHSSHLSLNFLFFLWISSFSHVAQNIDIFLNLSQHGQEMHWSHFQLLLCFFNGCRPCLWEFLPFLRYNDNANLCFTFQALIFHVFNLLAEKRSKPLSRVCQRCWGHILSRILPTIMCYNPQICLWGHFNGIHIQNIQVGRILEQFIFYSWRTYKLTCNIMYLPRMILLWKVASINVHHVSTEPKCMLPCQAL